LSREVCYHFTGPERTCETEQKQRPEEFSDE